MTKELKKVRKELEQYKSLSNAELVLLGRTYKTKSDAINILIAQRQQEEGTIIGQENKDAPSTPIPTFK